MVNARAADEHSGMDDGSSLAPKDTHVRSQTTVISRHQSGAMRWYRFQGQVSLLFWAVVELLELSRCEIVESRVSSFEDVVSDVVGHLTDCCLST